MTRRHSFAFARAGSGQSPAQNLARGSWVLSGLTCSKNSRSESDSGKKKKWPDPALCSIPSVMGTSLLSNGMSLQSKTNNLTLLAWYIPSTSIHSTSASSLECLGQLSYSWMMNQNWHPHWHYKKTCLGNFNAMWKVETHITTWLLTF